MHSRCKDVNNPDYGGRGISVCPEWATFEQFYADMGPKPSPQHSIDRIDNDGPYAPWNCRWATKETQSMNRRHTRRYTFQGRTQSLTEWSRELGIARDTLKRRVLSGWPMERVFAQPLLERPSVDTDLDPCYVPVHDQGTSDGLGL